jgi:hypothetical protein
MAALPPAPVPPPVTPVPPPLTSAGIDLNSVPQISKDALLNRRANYDLGGGQRTDQPTLDKDLAEALENDDENRFLALLGKGYDG